MLVVKEEVVSQRGVVRKVKVSGCDLSLSVIFSILWCQIPFRIDYRLNE